MKGGADGQPQQQGAAHTERECLGAGSWHGWCPLSHCAGCLGTGQGSAPDGGCQGRWSHQEAKREPSSKQKFSPQSWGSSSRPGWSRLEEGGLPWGPRSPCTAAPGWSPRGRGTAQL